jgi:hypothetical protein
LQSKLVAKLAQASMTFILVCPIDQDREEAKHSLVMHLVRFDQIHPFWQATEAYLCRFPAKHNLLLGVIQQLLHQPIQGQVYLAAVMDGTEIVTVALQTAPQKLLLAKAINLAGISLIAKDAHAFSKSLPGVHG